MHSLHAQGPASRGKGIDAVGCVAYAGAMVFPVTVVTRCLVLVALFGLCGRAAAEEPPPPATATPPPPPFPATVAPPSADLVVPPSSWVVEPYGVVTLNAIYLIGDSSNAPDVPQWATAGSSAFLFSARQSRFGLRGSWLTPPSRLGVQKVGGVVEADFYGGFAGQGLGYVFDVPRLRLATATVEWRHVRFSFGQDWSVLAPLNPDSALHYGVPGFATSGNLWARMPQMRVDGVIGFGGPPEHRRWRLIWAAALVLNVQADAIPAPASTLFTNVRVPQGGENSLAPAGEARVAIAHDLFGRALEIGVSGHLGNRSIAFTGGRADRLNGAVAVDVTLPLPGRLSIKGEAYWGDGLDAFFGGISQGTAVITDAMGAIAFVGNGIADAGGWGQVQWEALKWLKLYAGAGVDKPKTLDLIMVNMATNRTLNAAFYGAGSVEFARGFLMWLEYDLLHTEYQATPTQQTHVLSVSGQLAF